jgi:putative copper export protein
MSLQSAPARTLRTTGPTVVLVGLATSAAALAAAPALMPPGYSWVSHTTSESAAQGVEGAWLARTGFVLFGLAVILLATIRRRRWGPWATALHAGFGALLIAAAAFSHRTWMAGEAVDRMEDVLHSIAATSMGFAFVSGVVFTAFRRSRGDVRPRAFDIMAIAASVAIPLGMAARPDIDGVLQRLMFVVAYAWYAAEAVRATHDRAPDGSSGSRSAAERTR